MKSTTLVTSLTSLTRAMAVAASIVVFGFLYVLQVEPQRAASLEAREQLEVARGELNRQRLQDGSVVAAAAPSGFDEFETRAIAGDRVREVIDAVKAALSGPAVGGVSRVVIATGEPGDGSIDSIVGPFARQVSHTPVTVTFDARYEQIGRFFSGLRVLPTTFDLRAVELTPQAGAATGVMRAKVSLLVFHRPGLTTRSGTPQPEMADVVPAPGLTNERPANHPTVKAATDRASASPARPAPVVTGILVSGGRRVALVDGRVVGPGDRLAAGIVQSIEPDAVVIAGPRGQTRLLKIERRVIGSEPR